MEVVGKEFLDEIRALAEENNRVYSVETANGFNLTGRFREIPNRTLRRFYDRRIENLNLYRREENALLKDAISHVGHLYEWPEERIRTYCQETKDEWARKTGTKDISDVELRILSIENFGILSLQDLALSLTGKIDTSKLRNINHHNWRNVFLVGYRRNVFLVGYKSSHEKE